MWNCARTVHKQLLWSWLNSSFLQQKKDWTSITLANPHPLRLITSHFFLYSFIHPFIRPFIHSFIIFILCWCFPSTKPSQIDKKGKKIDKKQQQKSHILDFFSTIQCVIVTTGCYSHASYTMKAGDILSCTHVCQTTCVLRHSKGFIAYTMKGKVTVCYKVLQWK